jgi:hypothetical protein
MAGIRNMIVGGRQAAGHKEAEKEMLKLDLWNEEFPSAQELIECSCGWGHKFRSV